MKRDIRAFTLIELLMVVAIIAILAAIATPNFLEAQTRSKVSRVKADMRSIATVIEAYRLDANNYMQCSPIGKGFPSLAMLTTPIAYITGVKLADPFFGRTSNEDFREYGYAGRHDTGLALLGSFDHSLWWMLTSNGPDTVTENYSQFLDADNFEGFLGTFYDPTNGIVSDGNIYRAGGQIQGRGASAGFYACAVDSQR
ncbi:prepilin-type N-terminal cleavage/methylation domain-containing protein [Candidatus Poribacteria bacterium]|nr:prepilin-type N-terminal cleavage/methylation domain-containing protein [Candidatus Poribacteria bacterium]